MIKRMRSAFYLALFVMVVAGCGSQSGSTAAGAGPQGGSPTGVLTWDAPSSYTDGSPLTDLAGYKIYYGTAHGNYTSSINVGNTTSISVADLSSSVPASGLYYLAVTAYDTAGNESTFSNEVSISL